MKHNDIESEDLAKMRSAYIKKSIKEAAGDLYESLVW